MHPFFNVPEPIASTDVDAWGGSCVKEFMHTIHAGEDIDEAGSDTPAAVDQLATNYRDEAVQPVSALHIYYCYNYSSHFSVHFWISL